MRSLIIEIVILSIVFIGLFISFIASSKRKNISLKEPYLYFLNTLLIII